MKTRIFNYSYQLNQLEYPLISYPLVKIRKVFNNPVLVQLNQLLSFLSQMRLVLSFSPFA